MDECTNALTEALTNLKILGRNSEAKGCYFTSLIPDTIGYVQST